VFCIGLMMAMGSHRVHTDIVPCMCSALAWWWLWDPIECTLIFYLVCVVHWPDDGYGIPWSAHWYCTLYVLCIGLMMAMGSHGVHTDIVPCMCSALAWWWLWDPIECTLILYLVCVLHWPDDGYEIPHSAHWYCTLYVLCIGLMIAVLLLKHIALM